MEKLQPILTHKFWIVFAAALILPPVGWWSASGDLVQTIEQRKSTLDALKVPPGGSNPNQRWIEEVKKWNDIARRDNQLANLELWQMQEQLMVWPDEIKGPMATCKFRETHEDEAARSNVPEYYVDNYPSEVRRVWRVVEPIGDVQTKIGKVKLEIDSIPQVPANRWKDLYPSFLEIWDAQEDLWLLASLFEVVRNLNADTVSIGDSNIRQVSQIRLFGGKRKPQGAAAPVRRPAKGPGGLGGGLGMGGGGGGRGKSTVPTADFSLSEEFLEVNLGGKSGSKGLGGMNVSMKNKPKTQVVKKDPNARYIDFDANLPYRTRGFYLKVIMDHRRLPDLIAAFSEVKYPVEIIRVHQSTVIEDKPSGASRGGSDSGSSGGKKGGDAGVGTGVDTGNAPPGGEGEGKDGPMGADAVKTAFNDDNLTTVVIAGLMTLYNPIEIDPQTLAAGQAQPNPTGLPNTNQTAPAGTLPGQTPPVQQAPGTTTPNTGTTPTTTNPNAAPTNPANPTTPTNPNGTSPTTPNNPNPTNPTAPNGSGTAPSAKGATTAPPNPNNPTAPSGAAKSKTGT